MKNTKLFNLIEFLLVLIILAASFLVGLNKTWFHPDESMWINQSTHFEDFFLRENFP